MIPQAPPRKPQTWQAPPASAGTTGADAAALRTLEQGVADGARISSEEALFLHEHADLGTLGRMADGVRARKHPTPVVTYIVDRNINPTNVCITDCGFCAFYRPPGHAEAYVLSREEIFQKVQETVDLGGR